MSSTSNYDSADQGLLLVFSNPGQAVSLQEFHDWYDNEHVPLRTQRFPEFLSAARYAVSTSVYRISPVSAAAAVGSETNTQTNAKEEDKRTSKTFQSHWAAAYSISSNEIFAQARYTSLREQRSAREAELLSRIGVLDRRIYRLTWDSAQGGAIFPSHSTTPASASASTHTPSRAPRPELAQDANPVIVLTSVSLSSKAHEEEYLRWYDEEHANLLARVPGWKRTRRFELVDALIVGREAHVGDAAKVPRFLAVSEYDNASFESTSEFKHATSTAWRNEVNADERVLCRERRVCELYKAWDPSAALSVRAE